MNQTLRKSEKKYVQHPLDPVKILTSRLIFRKMLYASTRNALTKSLGSTHFTDSLFATSKSDLTAEAYAAHKAHIAAPKPLSEREKEQAEASRQAGGATYEGSGVRHSHVNQGVGMKWSEEAIAAVTELGKASNANELLVLVSIAIK